MKDSAHLEKLLDSLKKEGPFREPSRWKGVCPENEVDASRRSGTECEQAGSKTPCKTLNVAWSENKEAILLGMLVSACVLVSGLLSGTDYVTLAGAVSFAVFAAIMAWVLIEYCLCFGRIGRH